MSQNLITIGLLGIIAYSGYKIYKLAKRPQLGDACKFKEGGADGVVVYTFDANDMKPKLKCRRCNPTGCASYEY